MTKTYSARKIQDETTEEISYLVTETNEETGKTRSLCVIRKATDFSGCSVPGYMTSVFGKKIRDLTLDGMIRSIRNARS